MVAKNPIHAVVDVREKRIRLSDVPKIHWMPAGRKGGRLSPKTVFKWAKPGIKSVKLQTEMCGGAQCTTETWLTEFFAKLTAAAGLGTPQDSASAALRQSRVDAFLDAAGL